MNPVTETILVIVKNAAMRKQVAGMLELSQFKVLTAANGKEGTEMARTHHPDLILCDIILPKLDGFATLHLIEETPELVSIPFIFINAKWDKKDFRKAMELGADDYLPSPFDGDDLLKVIRLRLRKKGLTKKTFQQNQNNPDVLHNKIKALYELSVIKEKQIIIKLSTRNKLYVAGDTIRYVYFVLSGKIKTFKTNEHGQSYITSIFKEGDFFGYIDLLDGHHHKESAMAMEDTAIAEISREDFLQLLHSDSEVSARFIALLTDDIAEAKERLLQLAYDSVRKKTAEALIYLADKYRDRKQNYISFPAHRDNISSIAGISPESVSRNLTDFREEKLIETENGIIKIIDLKKLVHIRG